MMSDSEEDLELLALLRKSMQGKLNINSIPNTHVLESAEYVYNNAIDVAIDMKSCKTAAASIHSQMQTKQYSTKTWSEHELHPKTKDESTVNFIFTMDLLNFSFWSERCEDSRFCIEYKGRKWTGYWSLVAALQRALDEGIPITTSDFWQNRDEFTIEVMDHVFRSATDEPMPMLLERLACLRQAGTILYEHYGCSIANLVNSAQNSAVVLVNNLARDFACFRDEVSFENRKNVRLLKRAQILVADLWACFNGEAYGEFYDIDKITIFADYRIPQILNSMGCLWYGPGLENAIRTKQVIESGSSWEIQVRGCSIWCVELIRREIKCKYPEAEINAILIDYFLYDTMKDIEKAGGEQIPHHRTRSIWY